MNKIKKIVSHFIQKVKDDHVGAYSSQAAYYIILSALPFAIFVLSIIQYTPLKYDDMLSIMQSLAPSMATDMIMQMMHEIYTRSTITVMSITVFFVLWAAGRAIFSMTNCINEIYGIKETRGYFHLRLVAALYTMLLAISLVLTFLILVFGKQIYNHLLSYFPVGHEFFLYVLSIRVFVIFAVLVVFFIFLYRILPNRKTKLLHVLPGAFSVAIGWLITSYFIAFLFRYTNSFSYLYGSMTGIMVIMFWLYLCMFQLFIGAELNYLIHPGKPSENTLNDIIDN